MALADLKVSELRALAKQAKVRGFSTMKKDELLQILEKVSATLPICYEVRHGDTLFGYCLKQHYAGVATTLYYAGWDLEEAHKLNTWSDKRRMKQLLDAPPKGTLVKLPPQ